MRGIFHNPLLLTNRYGMFRSVHNTTSMKKSLFLLDRLVLCASLWTRVCIVNLLIWVGVALVIVLTVNCVQAFSNILSGSITRHPCYSVFGLCFIFLINWALLVHLGNHCASGKDSFLLCSLWERKQTLVFLDVIILTYNMGMTKVAFLAADFDCTISASLQLLDTNAAICDFTKCETCYCGIELHFTPSRWHPFTMFFICQKHYCSMWLFMGNSSQNCNVLYSKWSLFSGRCERMSFVCRFTLLVKENQTYSSWLFMSFSNLDSEGNSSDGESLVKMCITLTDMSLKSALRTTKSDCLMCYDVNRYYTLHSISIALNNKALCLQLTVQRFVLFCARFHCFFLCKRSLCVMQDHFMRYQVILRYAKYSLLNS